MYLGHLFVEPRRHAPGLADLTDDEARAVGWWCMRASRALQAVAWSLIVDLPPEDVELAATIAAAVRTAVLGHEETHEVGLHR